MSRCKLALKPYLVCKSIDYSSSLLKVASILVPKKNYGKKLHREDPERYADMPVKDFSVSTSRNYLYAWGYSQTGSLGRSSFVKPRGGGYRKVPEVKNPYLLNICKSHKIKHVACGNDFTIICATHADHNHQVFGTGLNTDSQLGYHAPKKDHPLVLIASFVPIQIPLKNQKTKVIKVSAGRAHTIILTDQEGVFSLGNNSFGQCGRPIIEGEIYEGSNIISKVEGIEAKVIDVVCGQDHTLFLTDKGEVYSSGWGADGQTGVPVSGQGHYHSQGIPRKVKGDIEGEKIVKVSGIIDCALAVSDKGDLFGWGNSEYGQLSLCTDQPQINLSCHLKIRNIDKVVQATAGGTNCAILDDKGRVFVWGYGILGQGPQVTHVPLPTLLPQPLFGQNELNPDVLVTQISCGLSNMAAITNVGDLYMWGRNQHSCLGLGHTNNQYFPFRVSIPAGVRYVSCGTKHTAAICRLYI